MKSYISYSILGSMVETEKYIEVSYGNVITVKQTEELQIKCVTIISNS